MVFEHTIPSIAYGITVKADNAANILELTVNIQKVRMPILSKSSSYKVVKFIVTPIQTQTTTIAQLIKAKIHCILFFLTSSSISTFLKRFFLCNTNVVSVNGITVSVGMGIAGIVTPLEFYFLKQYRT